MSGRQGSSRWIEAARRSGARRRWLSRGSAGPTQARGSDSASTSSRPSAGKVAIGRPDVRVDAPGERQQMGVADRAVSAGDGVGEGDCGFGSSADSAAIGTTVISATRASTIWLQFRPLQSEIDAPPSFGNGAVCGDQRCRLGRGENSAGSFVRARQRSGSPRRRRARSSAPSDLTA